MEALVYIANLLYLSAYFMQDLLRLRLLAIVAMLCSVSYFYFRAEPMLTIVYWNLFFVALNLFQITRMFVRRRRSTGEEVRRLKPS